MVLVRDWMTSLTQPLLDNSEMNGNMGLEWVDHPVPIPGKEKKLVKFSFSHFVVPKGLHKTFWGTTKKCQNKNLT